MASAFTTAEIEDGTGKSTALVYETIVAAEAWLTHTARSLTAFSSLATDALRDASLLNATVFFENILRSVGKVDGRVLTKEQALAFPRVGCTSRSGRTFESDEIPPDALFAIRHFAELDAASPLTYRDAGNVENLKSESVAGMRLEYRKGAGSIAERYPLPWSYLSRLWDPCQRRATWAA